MNFKEELAARTAHVNEILDHTLPLAEGKTQTLRSAMRYSVEAGGKRLRPIMIAETYRLFGGKGKEAEPFMAAMEMIHNHSLVHDDLPAMDNDKLRRGKPTTHVQYGEAMAILAGDALLNFAYETAATAFALLDQEAAAAVEGGSDAGKALQTVKRYAAVSKALQILSQKTGITGMIGGQCVDVERDGQKLDKETLDFIYDLKTGALIEGSLMIGAALAGADETAVKDMERVGSLVGLAFQIQDDILDVVGDETKLGKPLHSDEKNEKTTYVTVYGIEKAQSDVRRLTDEAVAILDKYPAQDDFLRTLLLSLCGREM